MEPLWLVSTTLNPTEARDIDVLETRQIKFRPSLHHFSGMRPITRGNHTVVETASEAD